MTEETPKKQIPLFTGEPFERMVGIVIAVVTLLAALVAILEADAGGQTAQAIRRSQQYAIQAMGAKAGGEVQTAFAWTDAYRNWLEWDTAAMVAQNNGDTVAAQRYEAVRDRAANLSPLLAEPYFNPQNGALPNVKAFEANTWLIETTTLTERFINAIEMGDALETKEKAYGSQLLLLAVSLFLFGLSVTIMGRMRWLFIGMGALIVNVAMIWMVTTYISPITIFSDAAIVAYAEGVGLAHQDDFEGAVNSFDQAIAIAPNYANAYYARGNAYFDLGQFRKATRDYELTVQAGRDDANVYWNLGWAYYILGESDRAIEATSAALAAAPDQVALHFNLGLTYLAAGKLDTAQAIYAQGVSLAEKQVALARRMDEEPPASLWWYLNTAATDLSNLLMCLDTQQCYDSPPYAVLAKTSNVIIQPVAKELELELKELSVALEYPGQSPREAVTATINNIEFATGAYDETGQLTGYVSLQDRLVRFGQVMDEEGEQIDANLVRANPDENVPVFVLFNFDDMADGQLFTMKVYKEGQESPGLRLVEKWALGQTGEMALPLTPGRQFALASGEYQVELYVEAQLLQTSSFIIE